jgi:hypothetical protein
MQIHAKCHDNNLKELDAFEPPGVFKVPGYNPGLSSR